LQDLDELKETTTFVMKVNNLERQPHMISDLFFAVLNPSTHAVFLKDFKPRLTKEEEKEPEKE